MGTKNPGIDNKEDNKKHAKTSKKKAGWENSGEQTVDEISDENNWERTIWKDRGSQRRRCEVLHLQ